MNRIAVAEVAADTSPLAVFRDFVSMRRPVIVRGAAHWPCREKWTPDYLCAHYGDVTVDFLHCEQGIRIERPLADYFRMKAHDRPQWYVSDWDFRKRQPELLEDFDTPAHFRTDWLDDVPSRHRPDLCWIYVGHAGTYGPTHVDNYGSSAWLAVLQGRKRVRFAEPAAGVAQHLRGVDLFDHDAPDDRIGALWEAVLDPADVLYVPAGWWHAARNDSYCLSLTANFIDGANFGQHRAFSIRHWYGRSMLDGAIDRWRRLDPGADRELITAHLSLACLDYRQQLREELDRLDALQTRLAAGEPPSA